jgi:hypothetical protein
MSECIHSSPLFAPAASAPARPRWLAPMAFATLGYLAFELAFNARLLDVTGGIASQDEIASIEHWGRALSGVALMLALWGSALLPLSGRRRWGDGRTALALAATAAISLAASWYGESALVDRIVDGSDGVTRRAAAHLRTVTGAIEHGAAAIDGIALTGPELRRPEGKSLLAIFPFVALSTRNLEAKSEAVIREVARELAISEIGTPEQAWNDAFVPSVRSIKDSYNAYADASEKRADAIAGALRRAEDAWHACASELAAHNPGTQPINPAMRRAVALAVQARGIDVPEDWNPADKGAFVRAAAAPATLEADRAFREAATSLAGAPLPADLEFAEFEAQAPVQARWRAALGAPPEGAPLSHDMTLEAFKAAVWAPEIDASAQQRAAALLEPPATYADGGARERDGRLAMEALAVPPIALAFSLLGALVHICKASSFAARIWVPGLRRRNLVAVAVVAAIAVLPWFLPNEVSRSPTFDYMERQTWQQVSPVAAIGARWVVQAQPWFYPVNEAVRRRLLLGFGFGYEPRSHYEIQASAG